jgi:hypothetical protein
MKPRFRLSALGILTALLLAGGAGASDPGQNTHPKPAKKMTPLSKPVKKAVQQVHPEAKAAIHQKEATAQQHPKNKTSHPAAHESRPAYVAAERGTQTGNSSTIAAKPNRAELTVLGEQLHALRTEEAAVVSNIRTSYEQVIQSGHLTMAQRNAERQALADQEAQYLAVAAGATDREAIRAQYGLLRNVLGGEVKLDNVLIRRLRNEEKTLVRRVQKLYGARIAKLEKELHGRRR